MEPLEPDPGTARAEAAQAVTRRLLPDGRWLIEMVDERGRVWSLPLDNQTLGVLLRRYIHKHGELARPVHRTFARHGRLDELRLLVLRCVEGESVNLAARALALGPVPPTPAPACWPEGRPWVWDILDQRDQEQLQALAATRPV